MKVIVVAGTHSGAGSTTVSISVMNCLRKQGLRVQAFKFGPGFRENDLFEAATGRMAVNLDPWNVPRDCLLSCVHRYGAECDVAVIDGSGGLFDGEEWSTAELARLLSAPVILVVDAAPMRQSCAAVVKGFEMFDKKIKVMGVVMNRVTDGDHAALLMKTFDKVGVKAQSCGFLMSNEQIGTFMESSKKNNHGRQTMEPMLDDLSRMAQDLNTSKFIEIATSAKVPKCPDDVTSMSSQDTVKIAIAKDAAFSFYYHENFMMLERAGAELVFFSPLEDERLPRDVAGIYLGGGHPELHAARLSENTSLMASIRAFAIAGGVIYAEGGGLLYLSRSIENPNEFPPHNLVGVFPFRTRMGDAPPEDSGYVSVEILSGCPVFSPGLQAKGHICHGSHVVQEIVRSAWGSIEGNEQTDFDYTYRLSGEISKHGITKEGYTRNSVLASYVHLQFASNQRLAPAFVDRCKRVNLTKVQEAVNRGLMKMTAMDTASRRAMHAKRMSSLDSGMNKETIEWGFKSTRFSEEISKKGYYRKSLSRPPDSPYRGRKSDLRPVQLYSCEMPAIEDMPSAAEAFGIVKKQPMKRRELRKSFSLEDVGTASNDLGRHSGNAKIVGMSTTGVEMICALGLENRLVGVTNLCNYPANIQSGRAVVARTKFEASHLDDSRLELKLKDYWCRQESAFEIDEDFLRLEQPALVIVEDGGDPDKSKVDQIFKMRRGSFTGLCPTSPTTVLSHKCRHLSEILEFMLRIGQAAGVEDASALIVDQLRSRVAKIGTLVATDFPVEKVVVLTCLNPLMIGGHWIPEMVSLAGGEPLGAKAGHAAQRVTWQELKAMEPEVMILAAASWDETKQELAQLASLPGWWGMPAMKTGQLYVCDPKLFSMAGPRLIDGIELLARILHPSSAGQYGKQGMAWSCTLRTGKRCRPCYLYRQFCALL